MIRKKKHDVRVEMITDDERISRFNVVLLIQGIFAVFVLALLIYAALPLADVYVFGWSAVLYIAMPILGVLVVVQVWAVGVYHRQTRMDIPDPDSRTMALYVVGKPLMREIKLSMFLTTLTFALALFVTVIVRTTNLVSASITPTPPEPDKRVLERQFLILLNIALVVLWLVLAKSIAVQLEPIATVTRATAQILKWD